MLKIFYETKVYTEWVLDDKGEKTGEVWDEFEGVDNLYLVKKLEYDDDGTMLSDECISDFETYQEAVDFIKEYEKEREK